MVEKAGGNVTIAESPGGPYNTAALKGVYSVCGVDKAIEGTNAKLNFDTSFTEVHFPEGKTVKKIPIINPILNADVIISLPKLKTHAMTSYTGAVKNLFGTIPGTYKAELHFRLNERKSFCSMLVDLHECVKPTLSIMDAVWGMEGNGPSGGKPRFIGTLIGGINPYAVDMVCASMISLKPSDIFMLASAMERGLCPKTVEEIEILGLPLSDTVISDFLPPQSKSSDFIQYLPSFLRPLAAKIATPVPKIRTGKCIGCGKCAESCPQHTIEIKHKKAYIIYDNCIRCYCCHEMCPEHIIDIKRLALFNL